MKKLKWIIGILVVLCTVVLTVNKMNAPETSSTGGSSHFSNKYGNASTKCAHPGCSRTIAKSGDTNCCTSHSNRCGNCRCYIDEDAMYCMDCIRDALG